MTLMRVIMDIGRAVKEELGNPMEAARFAIGMFVLLGIISIITFVLAFLLFFGGVIQGSPLLAYIGESSFLGMFLYPLGMGLNKIMMSTRYMRMRRYR